MQDDQLTQLLHSLDRDDEPNAAFADGLFERLSSTAAARAHGHSRAPFLLLAAALMLVALGGGMAFGSGLIKLPGLSRVLLPAPSVAATPTPLPSPSAEPSASAAVSSTPTPSETTPAGPTVDQIVHSTVDGLTVRGSASLGGKQLGTIAVGTQAFVVDGPREADGYRWYELSGIGLPPAADCPPVAQTNPFNCPAWMGWVASAAADGTPWLEPSAQDCPPSPMNLDKLALRPDLQRLACYGNQTITFRGWWPTGSDAGSGATCQVSGAGPRWLVCQNINYNLLDVAPSVAGLLRISIDPATGVVMPDRGQWVEVAAHLDDPAAQQCRDAQVSYLPEEDPARRVLNCRGQLAVESVKVVDGPY